MQCPECHFRFAVNWQVGKPAPGTFLIIGLVCLTSGILVALLDLVLLATLLWGLAILFLQRLFHAWADCRDAFCPQCKFKVHVHFWSR